MSFFDNYTDLGGGGRYLGSEDKQFLIDNGVTFHISALTLDADNQYGPRYVAFCSVPNKESGEPEEVKIGFPVSSGVDSRDAMLKQMEVYLKETAANTKPGIAVKLEKPGRAILIVSAE